MRRFFARTGRWTIFFFLFIIMLTVPCYAHAVSEPGDIDGDGRTGAADAAVLLRAVKSGAAEESSAFDVYDLTQNGRLDGVDARVLLSLSAGKIPNLVEFVEKNATGFLGEEEFDRFSYTGVEKGDGYYRSADVSVTYTEYDENKLVYYIADIWIRDISSFRTALSNGDNRGKYQTVPDMAAANDAVIAINGDFYKARGDGPIVRNGTFLRSNYKARFDQCIMTNDGVITTYLRGAMKLDAIQALKPYQMWLFGPRLLDDDGNAMEKFNSPLTERNPRTVIGYYAPGHYCFILVDGRQEGYSGGITLKDLSALCFSLGLKAAYNVDGGQTSAMATADGLVSKPYRGGRILSDIVYISEPAA